LGLDGTPATASPWLSQCPNRIHSILLSNARSAVARFLGLALLLGAAAARAIPPEIPVRALSFQTWGQEAGLPQISVRDLARDPEGDLWVATENGLSRFDGTSFENFHQADTPALKSSWISRLQVDRAGRLWIGTIKNLALREGGSFRSVNAAGKEVGRVNGIAEAPESGVIYVAADGLFRFQQDTLQALEGWPGVATAVLAGPDAVWVAGRGRLARFVDGQQQDFALPVAWADTVVTQLAWASDALWLASDQGLLRFAKGRFQPWSLEANASEPKLLTLTADGSEGLWAGSDKVLYRLYDGRVIERLDAPAPGLVPWPLSIKAGADSLWLGSQSEGLQYSWRSQARRFSLEEGLSDAVVWSYWADGERLLIGTNSGVSVYDKGRITPLISAQALPNPVAYSLMRDSAGRLWVGTRAGLARFAPDGRPLGVMPAFAGLQINGLLQQGEGAVWVATTGGLFRVQGDEVQAFGDAEGLSAARIRYVLETDGGIWVGTESGLFRQQAGQFQKVSLDRQLEPIVTTLAQLPDGRLLAGTYDGGLYWQRDDGWQHWGLAEGLPSQSVFFLGLAGEHLVVAGGDGVYRLPIAALAAGRDEPLEVEVLVGNPGERQGRARLRCCNGAGNGKGLLLGNQAWLPTLDGALQVQIDAPARAPPQAIIRGVEHAGRPLTLAGRLRLEGMPRDALIRYGAVDYQDPERLQFRYRLQGFEQAWVAAGERRTAIYTNLPPGRFSLEVQARHPFGVWGPSAQVMLDVPRLWFETWLFKSLAVLALIVLVALLTGWRSRRLERQTRALEAVVEQRTRALAESNAQLAEANRELKIASHTDALTGLGNRRFLDQCLTDLQAALEHRRRETGRDLVIGVILIDLDHFKSINDRFGHAVGDVVLQGVARTLLGAVREGEFVLRWGGEEFLAILGGVERHQLVEAAQRLHQAVARSCQNTEVTPGVRLGGVTGSVGFATYPLTPTSGDCVWQTAIEAADHALYAAKAAGRNRCATFDLDRVPAAEWCRQIHASDIARWVAAGYATVRIVGRD